MTTPEPSYRTIQLTQGQIALVSPHRFEELNAHKWCAMWCKSTRSFYAICGVKLPNGKWTSERMHRRILGLQHGEKLQGDHINHDTLDNRDENLRIATPSENQHNRVVPSNNKSGFKGVSWHNQRNKWRADIQISGKGKYLGLFSTPDAAFAAYCMAAKQLHGDFAKTA